MKLPPIPRERSEKEFKIEPRLRWIQALQLAVKVIVPTVASYILVRTSYGHPFYPIPIVPLALCIVLPTLVCYFRVAWGTTIVFLDSDILFLRGQKIIDRISRHTIEKLQRKKDSLAFRYRPNGISRAKLIGREGFPTEFWNELSEYAARYATPAAICSTHSPQRAC